MSNFVITSIRGFHYMLTENSVHTDRSLSVVLLTQRITSSIALVSWWMCIWIWTGWVDKTVARGVLDWILVLDWIRAEVCDCSDRDSREFHLELGAWTTLSYLESIFCMYWSLKCVGGSLDANDCNLSALGFPSQVWHLSAFLRTL